MFRAHTPIIRSIRCWVAAYGFLHRVFGWVVVLRAAAWVVCTVRMVLCTVHTTYAAALKTSTHPTKNSVQKTICFNSTSNAPDDGCMRQKYVELRIHKIKLNYLVASSCISRYFMRKMHSQTNPKITDHCRLNVYAYVYLWYRVTELYYMKPIITYSLPCL